MAKRRLRVRRTGGEISSGGNAAEALTEQTSDGFTLTFSGGRGILLAEGEKPFSAVTIDRMEMAIPRISFPFDVSAGIRGLRNKRHELAALRLRVSLDDLEKRIRRRITGSQWVFNPVISFERGHAVVLIEYGQPGQRCHVSFRLLPLTRGQTPVLLIDEPRAYGPVPSSLLQVAVAVMEEMIGARPEGIGLSPRDLVKKVLLASLPKKGWRIPDYQGVRLTGLDFLADRALIEYRHPDFADGEQAIEHDENRDQLSWMLKMEESLLARDGDALLASGNEAGARSVYARLVDQEPDNPVLAARLAMVDVVDPYMREAALSLVSESLKRHPGRTDLAAVKAHGLALSGNVESEIEALQLLIENGDSLERLGAALRCGRLLLGSDPRRAIDALEIALAARREDRGALESLMEAYVALGDSDKLHGLIPRWIAAHKSQGERATAHISVGRILLDRIGDPKGATHHFERAALANPDNRDAAWGLAESLAKSNNPKRALSTFERMERLCRESEDSRGAARACAAIGQIWLELGEPSPAIARFREALQLSSESPSVRVLLAKALAATGRKAEAAGELEVALQKEGPECPDEWWGRCAVDLASIYLEMDETHSAEHWIEASIARPESEDRARKMRMELLEKQQRWRALADELNRETGPGTSEENAVRLARAQLNGGDLAGAMSTLEWARQSFPERVDLLDILVEASRKNGDVSALYKALVDRHKRTEDPRQRSAMELEIGRLELFAFENPEAALYWLTLALEGTPSMIEARQGMVETLRRLGRHKDLDHELEKLAAQFEEIGQPEDAALVAIEQSRVRLGEGRAEEAAGLALKALPNLPKEARVSKLVEMAEMFRGADAPKTARQLFAAARRECEGYEDHQLALNEAETALEIGDCEEALAAAKVAGSGPVELRARSAEVAAKALAALDRPEEAVSILERVAENLDPEKSVSAYVLAARIASGRLGDNSLARQLLYSALSADPGSSEAEHALLNLLESSNDKVALAARLASAGQNGGEDGADRLMRAAEIFSAEGMHDRAARVLKGLYESDPNPEVERLLTRELVMSGKTDEISQPETAASTVETVDVDLEAGSEPDEVDTAAADSDPVDSPAEIALLFEEKVEPWEKIARDLGERGEWDKLATKLQQRMYLLKDPTERAATAVTLGRIFDDKLGDERKAEAAWEQALGADPKNREALAGLAGLSYKQRKWSRLDHLLTSVPADSTRPEVEIWRAEAADRMGRPDQALDLYRKIAVKGPPDARSVEGLAKLAVSPDLDEEVVRAVDRLTAAIGADKLRAEVLGRVGLARMRMGDMEGARRDLHAADRISGGDEDALRLLASIHEQQGRRSEQIEVLSRLAGMLDDSPDRATILERISELLGSGFQEEQ